MKIHNIEITKKRIGPSGFELVHAKTKTPLGRYGGREGRKWAQSNDGEMLTEDSVVSVRTLQGLIVGAAERKGMIPA